MMMDMDRAELKIWKLGQLLLIAAEELQETRDLKGLPPLNHIGRWEYILQMRSERIDISKETERTHG